MVQAGSAVRVEELFDHFRTAIATVMEIRHAIWVDHLEGNSKGLDAPASVAEQLGEGFAGAFTATDLKGKFRFKPYGSVETANTAGQLQAFNGSLQALAQLGQMFPQLAPMLQQPDILKGIVQEWARVYKVRNPQLFLKALTAQPQGMLPAAGGMDAGGAQVEGIPGGGMPSGGLPDLAGLLAALSGGAGVQ
jgi:hypothetical protein